MKRTTQIVAAFALLALTTGFSMAADKTNYCYDNPAIASDLKPNILLLLDTSVSMNRTAYADYGTCPEDNGWDFWSCRQNGELVNSYDSNQKYPGYAHNNYWYKKDDNGNWVIVKDCTGGSHCNPEEPYWRDYLGPDNDDNDGTDTWYSGNYLNFLLMPRIDMARVVLVGGKGASRQTDTNFYETEHGEVIEPPTSDERTGVMHEVSNDARWGVATTNDQDGAKVSTPIGKDNMTDVESTVQNWSASGDTPLAESLWTAAGYYAQKTEASNMPGSISGEGPEYHSGDIPTSDNKDPFNYDGAYPECANSYVLLISDGMADADDKLPDDLTTYESSNLDFDLVDSNDATNGDYGLDNLAYYLWNNDFRPDIEGEQNILTYPVYAFGDNSTASDLMKRTAINGAFEDLKGDDGTKDGYPTYVENDCDLTGGNIEGVNCEEWDENLDDSPDAYFQAGKGTNLENQLRKAINAILERVSTGSTVATISTQTRSGGVLLQAYYKPQHTVIGPDGDAHNLAWRGHLRTLWTDPKGNIREDHNTDDDLILDEDRILRFSYDTEGREVEIIYYPDDGQIDGSTAKDNIPDTCEDPADSSFVDKSLNEGVPPVWEAGVALQQRQPGTANDTIASSEREIYFNHGNPDDPSDDTLHDLNVGADTTLAPYWQTSSSDLVAGELIKFIRGLDNPDGNTEDYRVRQADDLTSTDYGADAGEDVWKLGAIITSTPRVLRPGPVSRYADEGGIGYSDFYTSESSPDIQGRPPMVFVGANDGMMHAFYAGSVEGDSSDGVTATLNQSGDGAPAKEAWSFIPQNALPYLRWYGEMNSECNIPTVDYRVQLVDAATAGDPGDSLDGKDAWETLLIGTMGFGGQALGCDDVDGDGSSETLSSSVFVLDVTNPENPELLWEQNLDDQSLTLTTPAVVRRGNSGERGDWYVVLGSGPLDPEAETFVDADGNDPNLFVFNLRNGTQERAIDLTDANNFKDDNVVASSSLAVGEPLPFDPDQDNLTDAVYFGTYGGPGVTEGSLYRLHLSDDVTTWDLSRAAQTGSSSGRPFFAAPGAALDPGGELWIYAATGRFFSENDQPTTNSQYFFGFVDECWGDGSGKEEGDTYSGDCGNLNPKTLTVPDDLPKMDDVEVRAEPVSYECRCGSSFYETASDGGSTDCPDGSDLVIQETQVVEYNNCPDGVDCSSDDPATIRDEVKAEGGWYWKFTDGKRVFSQPAVFSGLVNVAGFTPATDLCTPGGTTVSHAVDYRTGTAPPKPVFLSSGGTSEISDSDKVTIESGIELGQGVPPVGQSYAASSGGREGELNTLTQPSTGEIKQLKQQVEKLEDGILFQQEQ